MCWPVPVNVHLLSSFYSGKGREWKGRDCYNYCGMCLYTRMNVLVYPFQSLPPLSPIAATHTDLAFAHSALIPYSSLYLTRTNAEANTQTHIKTHTYKYIHVLLLLSYVFTAEFPSLPQKRRKTNQNIVQSLLFLSAVHASRIHRQMERFYER